MAAPLDAAPLDAGAVRGLSVALEDLRTFKKRVDGLLDDLEGSAADPKKIGSDHLRATQIGHGFSEANDLMKAYTYVHEQLSTLSKSMADQIESMSILLHIGRVGLSNVDVETQNRLLDLNDAVKAAYDPKRDPNARHHAHHPKPGGDTSGIGGTQG
jgi:hypothetical protein